MIGAYPRFTGLGWNDRYLPVWLSEAGFDTYYIGKLMNGHSTENYDSPYPAGWTASDFLLDPDTYKYYNATWQRGQEKPVQMTGTYSTDVLANKTLGYIKEAAAKDKPFFLMAAPIAPHTDAKLKVTIDEGLLNNIPANILQHPHFMDWLTKPEILAKIGFSDMTRPPLAAERHAQLFSDSIIPRTPEFNPETVGSHSCLALHAADHTEIPLAYRCQLSLHTATVQRN